MRVRLTHPEHPDGPVAPWQDGELVTLQIVGERSEAGDYEAETVETYPADLRATHAAEIERLQADHALELGRLLADKAPASSAVPLLDA